MSEINVELDRLLENLEPSAGAESRQGDAIDRVLSAEPRATRTWSLRDDEVVQRFREEVVNGLIRVDTVQQLLGLIRLALETDLV